MFGLGTGMRRKLLLSYLAIAVPLIVVITLTHYNHYLSLRDDVITARVGFARDIASNTDRFVKEVSNLQRSVGATVIDNGYTRRKASAYLSETAANYPVVSMDFVRVTGEIYASSDLRVVGTHLAHADYDAADFSSKLTREKDWAISPIHTDENGVLGIDIITGVWNKKGLAGIMVTSVDATRLGEVLQLSVPGGGFNITDNTGKLVFQSQHPKTPLSQRNWSEEQFIKAALSGREYKSYGLNFPVDDSYRMGVQVPIKSLGWTAGAFVPVDEVLAPIRADVAQSGAIALLFVIVAVFLGLWIGDKIVRPVTVLAHKAKEIAAGNFDEEMPEMDSDHEIKELADSFDSMRMSLKEYVGELHGLVVAGEQMNKALDVASVEDAVASALRNHFNAKAVWIALYDDNRKQLKVDRVWGVTDLKLSGLTLVPGQGVAGKVLMTGKPSIVRDLESSEFAHKDALLSAGIDSAITLPLISGGGPLGTIGMATPLLGENRITDKEMGLLMALANQAAVAIENARLYEETRLSEKKLKDSNEDLRILNNVALDIASGLNLDELLEKIERNAMELVSADFASIGLYDDRTGRTDYHHYVSSSTGSTPTGDLPNDLGFSDLVLKVRRTVYTNDYRHDARADKKAVGLGVKAAVVAPLLAAGRLVGFVQVGRQSDASFSDNDIALLEAVGRQAAIAVENARLYEQERNVADTLQNMLLAMPDSLAGIKVGLLYRSATEKARVGGDFYDFIEFQDGRIGAVIGDVSGKGLGAATATALAKMTVRAFAYEHDSPADVLTHANSVILSELEPGQFITMAYLVVDPRTGDFTYASAGHPMPIIADYATFTTRQLSVGETPLGVVDDPGYVAHADKLDLGEALLLFTDGLLEARSDSEIFGEERIKQVMLNVGDPDVEIIPQRLMEAAEEYAQGKLDDDVAVVVLIRNTGSADESVAGAADVDFDIDDEDARAVAVGVDDGLADMVAAGIDTAALDAGIVEMGTVIADIEGAGTVGEITVCDEIATTVGDAVIMDLINELEAGVDMDTNIMPVEPSDISSEVPDIEPLSVGLGLAVAELADARGCNDAVAELALPVRGIDDFDFGDGARDADVKPIETDPVIVGGSDEDLAKLAYEALARLGEPEPGKAETSTGVTPATKSSTKTAEIEELDVVAQLVEIDETATAMNKGKETAAATNKGKKPGKKTKKTKATDSPANPKSPGKKKKKSDKTG